MTVFNTSYSTIEEAWADSYLSPSLQKKQKKKKNVETSSPMADPICELYEMGNNNKYDDSDIVSYANKFYEKHEKARYQNAMMNNREKLPKVVDVDVTDDIISGSPYNRDVKKQLAEKMDRKDFPYNYEGRYQDRYNEDSKYQTSKYQDSKHDDNIRQRRHYDGNDDDNDDNEGYNEGYKDDYTEGDNESVDIMPRKRDKVQYDTREGYGDDDDFGNKNRSFNYFDIILYIISGVILIFMMEQFVKIGMLMK